MYIYIYKSVLPSPPIIHRHSIIYRHVLHPWYPMVVISSPLKLQAVSRNHGHPSHIQRGFSLRIAPAPVSGTIDPRHHGSQHVPGRHAELLPEGDRLLGQSLLSAAISVPEPQTPAWEEVGCLLAWVVGRLVGCVAWLVRWLIDEKMCLVQG